MPYILFGGWPTYLYKCSLPLFYLIYRIEPGTVWGTADLECFFSLNSAIVQNFINIHTYVHTYTRVSHNEILQDDNIANRYTLRLY